MLFDAGDPREPEFAVQYADEAADLIINEIHVLVGATARAGSAGFRRLVAAARSVAS